MNQPLPDLIAAFDGDTPPDPPVNWKGVAAKGALALAPGVIGLAGAWVLAKYPIQGNLRGPEVDWVPRRLLAAAVESGAVSLPPGHPRARQVYARHPVSANRYLLYSDFHQQILAEKAIEGTRLLLALGARDIEAKWEINKGTQGDVGVEVSVADLKNVAARADLDTGKTDTWFAVIKGARTGRRALPDLQWLGADPAFQLAVEAADSQARTIQLVAASSHTQTVNAQLAIPLEQANLALGGRYKRFESVSLSFKAEFD